MSATNMVHLCLPPLAALVLRNFAVVFHGAAEGQLVRIQNAHIPASIFLPSAGRLLWYSQ